MNNRTRQWNAEGTEEKGRTQSIPLFSSRPLFSSAPSALKIPGSDLLSFLR